ncbi:MAG: hypothetical protein V1732_03255 [Patescibacteria group bacterium]
MRKGEIQLDESVIAALENGNGDKTKNSKFWAEDRSEWQKEEIKNSREKVKAAQILRSHISAAEGVTETNHANEAVESETKTFKNEKAELEKHLVGLKELLDKTNTLEKRVKIASNMQIARDKMHEVDAKIANLKAVEKEGEQKQGDSVNIDDKADDWKKLIAQNKADKLVRKAEKDSAAAPAIEKAEKKEDNPKLNLNSNPLNLKNMEKNIEEDGGFDAYAKANEENALKEEQEKALKDFEAQKDKESGNLYDDVNKKYKLEAEQKKAKEAYESEFENRGKTSKNEKDKWDKLREKDDDDVEKEKRAARLKEKEEFKNAYKQQFGEEEDGAGSVKDSGKQNIVNNIDASVDNAPVDTAPVDNVSDLKKIIREREKNMPKKIGDELIDNDLEKSAQKIKDRAKKEFPELAEIIEDEKKPIQDLLDAKKIENLELREIYEKASNRFAAMKTELDKQIEEVKNPTLKESIIGFLKKPKVKGAIVFGLAGAAVYAASGGTAVPVYFAVKAALATAGVDIFVPAAAGYGLSTWGTAAVAGGAGAEFISYLSKKLGLSKGEKSDREKHQEGLENLKNIGSGQGQANETSAEAPIETPVKKEGFIGKMKKRIFGEKEQEKASKENTEQQPTEAGVKAVNESVELAEPAKAVETGKLEKPEAKEASKDNKPEVGNVILKETPARKEGSSAENLVFSEDQKKLFEAKDRFFGLSRLIGQNKEKINTNVLETIAELVNSEIEKGKYETVDPVVKLANDLVENKEKFDFFGKEANAGNRDNVAKEKLISEIKTHALHMENNGLLGATAEEKEKNRLAIAALLDSKEFKSQI